MTKIAFNKLLKIGFMAKILVFYVYLELAIKTVPAWMGSMINKL